MTAQQFRDKLLHNWQVKIICLAVAVLVYFYHELSNLDKKSFTVPLSVHATGMMVPASSLNTKTVKITVRGNADQLAYISDSDINAYVDITGETKEGDVSLQVFIQPSAKVLLMDSLEITSTPERVNLKIEEKYTKYVPIQPEFAGTPAHGYEIASVSAVPAIVKISGPKSMVESVSHMYTERIDIEGISGNSVREVGLVNENSLVTTDDSSFKSKVSFVVSQAGMSRQFDSIKVGYRNVPENMEIAQTPVLTKVVLEGQVLTLEKISASQITAFVDCSSITVAGTYTLPVRISVPFGSSVISNSVESITVTAFIPEPVSDEELLEEGVDVLVPVEGAEEEDELVEFEDLTEPVSEDSSDDLLPEENGAL